ncbi:MAG: cupin domain-containing protein [bacterium]
MNKPINLQSKFELFNEHWSPKVIAELNDYQFKLVKIKGQFTWHEHKETDEVFLVIEGFMGIEFKDSKVTLKEGEMIVVQKGEQHKPFAFEECKVLIIEPRGVINTGDTGGDLTSENDVWI